MKENTAIQDYLKFKKEHNIQKSIREEVSYKDTKYSKWIALFVLISTLVFIVIFGINATKETATLSLYNTWYVKGLLINLLIVYLMILYGRKTLHRQITASVDNYKQHALWLFFSDIDWESLSLRGYWLELVAEKYAFVHDEHIIFNHSVIHEELQYKEKPTFYFNSNKISIWFSIISPLVGIVLSFVDIKEIFGKEWQVVGYLLLIILLTVSPILYVTCIILRGKYTEKKNEHQSMQDYVIIMKYILAKRKLVQNQKSDKDLIKKFFRQMSRR